MADWTVPIGGEAVTTGEWIEVRAPYDDALLGRVPACGPEQVDAAVRAAKTVLEAGPLPAWQRAEILDRTAEIVASRTDELARVIATEAAKPIKTARIEAQRCISTFTFAAVAARTLAGDMVPMDASAAGEGKLAFTLRMPIGVVGAISPFNFPLNLVAHKLAPAIAAGCPVVLKPASQTPLSALALGELAVRAGVPKGVFNIVTGNARAIGGEMTSNPTVRKITFTGSTEIGRVLMRQSADQIKKLGLELGGNAPFIVFDDADLDAAAAGAIVSKYRNNGQTCVCANRIYVQDKVYDAFAAKLAEKVKALKVGKGTEAGVVLGPLIDDKAVEKVEEHVADAIAKGAKVALGGKRLPIGPRFFEPTILTGVTRDMKVAIEETFGPVAPLFRFKDEADVIAQANGTEFGLASYFYARDMGRVWRVAEALEAGIVGINTGLISTEVAPFGGVKQSGVGREGSKYGIDDFLQIKYLSMGGI